VEAAPPERYAQLWPDLSDASDPKIIGSVFTDLMFSVGVRPAKVGADPQNGVEREDMLRGRRDATPDESALCTSASSGLAALPEAPSTGSKGNIRANSLLIPRCSDGVEVPAKGQARWPVSVCRLTDVGYAPGFSPKRAVAQADA
jgi:hypothetical protein